ncbi:MAG: lyase domain protein repeat-containing protein [Chthonomonadaceae bacterium]|nr:lyase domain protein repeat-containing protein [Chthonomonadaceae bacterium]
MSTTSIEEALAHLKDTSFTIRRSDMKKLAETADAEAVAEIIALLQAEDWKVRARAAEALGEIGDASSVPMLIATLQDPGDYGAETHAHYVSDRAATALGKIGDSPALAALRAMLTENSFTVKMRAARALLEAGDHSAVPALLKMRYTWDASERLSVIRALAHSGDVFAVPALIEMLNINQSINQIVPVQEAAADALLELGDSKTLPSKILACSQFTAHERIELLTALRRVRYKGGPPDNVTLHYSFPDVRTLCQTVLNEPDEQTRVGAQIVLNWLDGDRDLLIASQPTRANEEQILLRAAQGSPAETRPDTLLIASDAPDEKSGPPPAPKTLWKRLFKK